MHGGDDLVNVTTERRHAPTADGWSLELKRTIAEGRLVPGRRPVLIVPGYGMNSFIFGFHPRGTSMERCLALAGFEVWSVNLRGQGASRATDPAAPGPSLRNYAERDLPAAVRAVLAATGARRVDVIGASLGGSIAYAHLALVPDTPVHGVVAVGAPLRWTEIHPVLRAAFSSPWLAGQLVVRGTRDLLRVVSGLLHWYPALASIYLNSANVDLTAIGEMVQTVEDPHPRVNRDIAKWLLAGDLHLAGVNVSRALGARTADRPLLLVVSNRDGIVPESANLSARDCWGGPDVDVLRVGDDECWYAHADLFVGNDAPRVVFEPMARWLGARGDVP